ncbi:MAG: hypothetical protein R3C10_23940 [Pirellulales bacterium]
MSKISISKPWRLQNVGERNRFLDEVCGTNRMLRERVEKLIRHADEVGDFLESPPPGVGRLNGHSSADVAETGSTIGPYRLVDPLGEGGWHGLLAEQTEPIHRRVALKVIKLGMDTKAVIARFEAERQALAMLDHPHIAKVLDAGATESGRPYFVMELVHGLPITEHCDEFRFTTRATTGTIRQGLRRRAARPPAGDHPPRYQAVKRDGHDP